MQVRVEEEMGAEEEKLIAWEVWIAAEAGAEISREPDTKAESAAVG